MGVKAVPQMIVFCQYSRLITEEMMGNDAAI